MLLRGGFEVFAVASSRFSSDLVANSKTFDSDAVPLPRPQAERPSRAVADLMWSKNKQVVQLAESL